VEDGLAWLSARHAEAAGPWQLIREALGETVQPAELQLSSQALGNRLACCLVDDSSHAETGPAGGAHADAQQVPTASNGQASSEPGSDDSRELLLARPSGGIGEALQVYVLRPAMQPASAVQLKVIRPNHYSCLYSRRLITY
jgi:hypothetical protein